MSRSIPAYFARKTSVLLVVGFGALITLAACGGQTIDPRSVGDPDRGRQIFETGADVISVPCQACHSLGGNGGGEVNAGPSLLGVSEIAGERVSGKSAEEYLRESILDPSAYVVEGYEDKMESGYRYLLSEEDVDDLVAFMLTQ